MGKRNEIKKARNKTKAKGKRREEEKRRCRRSWISFSRERVSSFSLESWEIRPSDFFETRRGVVLLGEDNV